MATEFSGRTSASPVRMGWLLLIGLLVVALIATVAIVGSQFRRSPATIPQGGAAVLAFDTFNDEQPAADIFPVRADGTDLRQLTTGPDTESFPPGHRTAHASPTAPVAGRDRFDRVDGRGRRKPVTLATTGPSVPAASEVTRPGRPTGGLIFAADAKSAGCDALHRRGRRFEPGGEAHCRTLNGASVQSGRRMRTRIAFVGKRRSGIGHTSVYVADVGIRWWRSRRVRGPPDRPMRGRTSIGGDRDGHPMGRSWLRPRGQVPTASL